MQLRQATLPAAYEPKLRAALERRGYSLDEPGRLAEAVLRLSSFYLENPSVQTPWDEKWAQAASLVYFFPLNYSRNALVAREASRFGFFDGLSTIVDDGAGMGAAIHAFQDHLQGTHTVSARDVSSIALRMLNELSLGAPVKTVEVQALERPGRPVAGSLLLASYVFTELKEIPREWLQYEALIILEPSIRDDARRLQKERTTLLEAGFHLWAPCPHEDACPLLENKGDWCHDRVHFEQPAWFAPIEKHLPIKNRTLSFSYLVARKAPRPGSGFARLTGDTLDEKGKSRQSLCRSSEREFLAWFPQRFKTKTHLEMSRGSLVRLNEGLEKKSDEVRMREPDDVRELGTDEDVRESGTGVQG